MGAHSAELGPQDARHSALFSTSINRAVPFYSPANLELTAIPCFERIAVSNKSILVATRISAEARCSQALFLNQIDTTW
jgi:hypothetical protein